MRKQVSIAALLAVAALLAGAGVVVVSAQQGVGAIITASMFQSMLPHRGDSPCPGAFYTYDAFIQAAGRFPDFGTTGGDEVSRRELAAFFGQTSHETNGGWPTAPDGPFAWGYCFVEERGEQKTDPPYYGRGPIQLTQSMNKYNYEQAGQALQQDLVGNPGLVSSDAVVSFETAIWFWMTPQGAKPSCHAVITNVWEPSADDLAAGRARGYGMLTNIINGGIECGKGQQTDNEANRVGYYQRYCQMLGVTEGDNLTCQNQKPYVSSRPSR